MITLKQWEKNQADITLWNERYLEYLQYLQQYQSFFLKEPWSDTPALLLQNIATFPNVHVFLAYKDDTPAGFAIIGTETECQCNCSFCVKAFYVFPECRNQGIGTEMLKQLYDKYTKNTQYAACLQVAVENDGALDFWIKVSRKLRHELRRDNTCLTNFEYGGYVTAR